MSDNMKKMAAALAIFIAGVAVGRFTLPAKVVTKIETKVEYKEKDTSVTETTKHNNKDLIIIETHFPDGTIKREKRLVDKGTVTIDSVKKTDKDSISDTKSEQTVTYDKNNWNISLLAKTNLSDVTLFTYGLSVQRRIIGPFYLGAFGFTDKTLGASIGLGL